MGRNTEQVSKPWVKMQFGKHIPSLAVFVAALFSAEASSFLQTLLNNIRNDKP